MYIQCCLLLGVIDSREVLSLDIYKNTIASFNVAGILFEPELLVTPLLLLLLLLLLLFTVN